MGFNFFGRKPKESKKMFAKKDIKISWPNGSIEIKKGDEIKKYNVNIMKKLKDNAVI